MVTIYTQAYNVEKYVSVCIESVLNQTFPDFKYILIDNGSTDGTRKILQNYADIDKRIKLICYDENTSGLRITHFSEFTGEYCSILDSDDWWEPNFLERMISFLDDNNLSIAITGVINYFDTDGTSRVLRKLEEPVIMSQRQFAQQYQYYWTFPSTIWGNVIKMDLYRLLPSFDNKYTYGVDTMIMLRYIEQCDYIGIDNTILYHYRIHSKNVSYNYDLNRFNSNIAYYNSISSFLKKHNTLDTKKQEWLILVHANSIRMTVETLSNSNLKPAEKINELKKITKHPLTVDALRFRHPDIYHTRDTLLSVLFKNIDKSENLDEILNSLTPKCAPAIKLECISLILMKPQLANALIADDPDALLSVLLDMIGKNELTKKYDLFSMVRSLSLDKLLLKNCDDNKFIRRYASIYLAIWREQYNSSLNMMTDVLQKGEKIDETFLQLYLNITALTNSTDKFLYGKLCSAGYHLYCKKYDECRTEINDLYEMGVEDNDEIIRIRRELEKVGK